MAAVKIEWLYSSCLQEEKEEGVGVGEEEEKGSEGGGERENDGGCPRTH